MTHVRILIVGVDDPPPMPEENAENMVVGDLDTFVVFEKGTQGGRTSVAFVVNLPDGKKAFVQTTSRLMDGMYHALLGAMQRFGDTFE